MTMFQTKLNKYKQWIKQKEKVSLSIKSVLFCNNVPLEIKMYFQITLTIFLFSILHAT